MRPTIGKQGRLRSIALPSAILVTALVSGLCAQPGTRPPDGDTDAPEAQVPFPPFALPEGFFSPFENERDSWTWINFKEKSIITFGHVCSFAQPIELAVCQAGGKTHESIIETFAIAQNIHTGALLLGVDQPRTPPGPGGSAPTVAHYDTATIAIDWLPEGGTFGKLPHSGERVSHHIEDLVLRADTGEAMPRVDWLFIGSYFAKVAKDWRNKDDTTDVYAADYFDWGLVTTYNTPGSVFDNPLPGGSNDEFYYGNSDVIPAAGTIVMIRIDFGEPTQRDILVAPEQGHRPDEDASGESRPPGDVPSPANRGPAEPGDSVQRDEGPTDEGPPDDEKDGPGDENGRKE